jgi:hypothetical protein
MNRRFTIFNAMLGILISASTDAVGFKPDPSAASGAVLNRVRVVWGASTLPKCQNYGNLLRVDETVASHQNKTNHAEELRQNAPCYGRTLGGPLYDPY